MAAIEGAAGEVGAWRLRGTRQLARDVPTGLANNAGWILGEVMPQCPTARSAVSHLAPMPRRQSLARVSADTAGSMRQEADAFEVKAGPGAEPENVARRNIDGFHVTRCGRGGTRSKHEREECSQQNVYDVQPCSTILGQEVSL